MDKNMIKIDDLLRQRLGDAEEQERPGAWLHMRELLDQQMPVRGVPGGAFNWRRMFGYLGGLVLLLAVSAGGYQALQSFNGDGNIAANTGGQRPEGPTVGLAGTAANTVLPERLQEGEATRSSDAVKNTPSNKPGKQARNQDEHGAGLKHDQAVSTSGNQSSTNNNPNRNNDIAPVVASGKTANAKTLNDIVESVNPGVKPTTTGGTSQASTGKTVSASTATKQTTAANNNPNTGTAANDNGAPAVKNSGKQTRQETQSVAALKPTEPSYDTKEISISKIERHERIGKNGEPKMDTIFNGEDVMTVKVPKEKEMLALNKNEEQKSGSNMNPAAAAPSATNAASEEDAPMQKLGDHKTASKKIKNYNPHRFEEMVRNAKFRMGSIKFYPGLVFGANAAINSNLGFHGGLAGNLSVSDRWSILAEAKYMHIMNFGKEKMQDDFVTNVKFNNINGKGVYTYDSMEHYYNFGSYANIEVPVMATFSYNRWIYMLGANIRYNFRISNIQEVEQRYMLEQSLTSTTDPKVATEKTILLSDFTPSLNIGPVLGVGYQFKPAWRMDLRISKPVWNNASTFGEKEIARQLYNLPQVQLNATWRFRSNKPYKRAQ
ncbi:MAG: outer membrane beta-barrel protein [Taibaiella sp.]|nr:outer membrane beta-barrel protein [Taibaiella sp.]